MNIDSSDKEYYLVIGDSHIPDRAKKLPEPIEEYVRDYSKKINKFHQIFFTGDLVKADHLIHFLSSVCRNREIMIVNGNMDIYGGQKFPKYRIFNPLDFPSISIGVIHGHQVNPRGDVDGLVKIARELNVKVLLSGHTHDNFLAIHENVLLINPGSCVGAWSFLASGIPSFAILSITKKDVSKCELSLKIVKYYKKIIEEEEQFLYDGNFLKI